MIDNFQVRILDAAHCPTYKPKVIREKIGKDNITALSKSKEVTV